MCAYLPKPAADDKRGGIYLQSSTLTAQSHEQRKSITNDVWIA